MVTTEQPSTDERRNTAEKMNVYAKVISVGGEPPQVRLALNMQEATVSADVTLEQAYQLAKHLYQEVLITGDVDLDRTSRQVTSLRIESVTELGSNSIMEVIDALSSIAGEFYEQIPDIHAYIADLRGESK